MAELDYEEMCLGIVNELRARAPYVSGNLRSSIKYFGTKSGSIMGRIEIGGEGQDGKQVEYAQFVNYGHLTHPNSKKLKRDYLFVEKGIRAELKNLVARYGGGYVK